MSAPRPTRTRRSWAYIALFAVSLVLHAIAARYLVPRVMGWHNSSYEAPVSVHVIDGDPLDALTADALTTLRALEAEIAPTPDEPIEEDEPEPEIPDGQVVETVQPDEERVPLRADYLAEHSTVVPLETRTEAYKVNPDVLSNQYSRESKMAFEDLVDVGATEKSSGATVGSLTPATPGPGAPRSILPSPWALTNKEGLAAPTQASSRTQYLAGAPQNDRLDEKLGSSVALNTIEFVGSAYINRIKRQVNLYWSQNVDNLPPSLPLTKPRYNTVVAVVLTSDGALEALTVTTESGIGSVDNAVVQAFRVAGPFPNPPEQLIRKDGRVYLSDLDFTLNIGHAQMPYQGIDPRAGVQFPGILKSPR